MCVRARAEERVQGVAREIARRCARLSVVVVFPQKGPLS
jgi:hypothetical protein